MRPLIWFIHGAYSTSKSFTWLRPNLPEHDGVEISYSSDHSIVSIIRHLAGSLKATNRPVIMIGHSLGGLIACALAQAFPNNVSKVITIGSPLGGSVTASFMRWVTPSPLLNDLQVNSAFIKSLTEAPIEVPVLSIVTTGGNNPMLGEDNDGVVAVSSQVALGGINYVRVMDNHFEALMSEDVASLSREFILDNIDI